MLSELLVIAARAVVVVVKFWLEKFIVAEPVVAWSSLEDFTVPEVSF